VVTRRHVRRPILAPARVRKARTSSRTCVLCARPITAGQTIGLIAAGWAHNSPCIVTRRQALAEPERP
jgi:hypothetical protein